MRTIRSHTVGETYTIALAEADDLMVDQPYAVVQRWGKEEVPPTPFGTQVEAMDWFTRSFLDAMDTMVREETYPAPILERIRGDFLASL